MYVWPVTQPTSAVHQKMSVGLMSNVQLIVRIAYSR